MARRTLELTDPLYDYLLENSLREPSILAKLRAETADMPEGIMQISPEQGQFMALLAQLIDARRVIEVGTFTGYSALAVAMVLPDNGRLTACDVNEGFTAIAQRYWVEAGVDHKIDLRLAPAEETLDALIADGQAGTCDMAFIDADKSGYDTYYERLLTLLRPRGLLLIDNVLWSGSVADPTETSENTIALRALNAKLKDDDRISLSLLPISDGITMAMKR